MTKVLIASLLLLAVVSSSQQTREISESVLTRSTLSSQQRLLGLSVLWREARFSFAYYDKVSANWDSLYQEFIPRVQAARTDYEYFLELMRFQAHLDDGHLGVFWPAAFNEALGYPPLEIRRVQGRAVIFRCLKQTGELESNHVRPGLVILEVDGRPVGEQIAYWRQLKTASTEQATDRIDYFRILTGPRNSVVEVRLEEPGGMTRTVRLTRSEAYFNDTNLPPSQLYSTRTFRSSLWRYRLRSPTCCGAALARSRPRRSTPGRRAGRGF
jgi:carboxyl-terminal processing protease